MTFAEKYAHKITAADGGCHVWTGSKDHNGYGLIKYQGRSHGAHKVAVLMSGRVVPDGYQIDHLCKNKLCVNPDHLDVVTQQENIRRQINAQREKTHCPKGHPYSGKNLMIQRNQGGFCRKCRLCVNAKRRRLYAKHRSEE